MDENDILTKEKVLKGKDYTETVEISIGTFNIRPLTIGEKATIKSLSLKDIKATGKVNDSNPEIQVDLKTQSEQASLADFSLIACGLSCENEKWSVAEVKQIKITDDDVTKLVNAILNISHAEVGDILPFRYQKQGSPELKNPDSF